MTKLKICAHKEVDGYSTPAAKDGISMKDANGAVWFQYLDAQDNVLGVCSLLPLGKSKLRLKAVWILKEHQGKGHDSAMVDELMKFARMMGGESLEVLDYNPEFYEARGFKKVGNPRPNGAQRLIKEPV